MKKKFTSRKLAQSKIQDVKSTLWDSIKLYWWAQMPPYVLEIEFRVWPEEDSIVQ